MTKGQDENARMERFVALDGRGFFFGYLNSTANRVPEVAEAIEAALTAAEAYEAACQAEANQDARVSA